MATGSVDIDLTGGAPVRRDVTTDGADAAQSERQFLKFGAACAVAGGVLAIIFNFLHPRSSDIGELEVELQLIRDNGEWLFVHMGILLAVLVVFAGLVALARSMDAGPAAPWARLTLYSALAALPVAFITVAIDGIAMKEIADTWAAAGPDQAEVLRAADAAGQVAIASFDVFIITLFGLTPIFAGLALFRTRLYPRWLGPVAIASGLLGAVTGTVQSFTGLTMATTNIMFPLASLAFTVVIIAAGLTLWRQADAVAAAATQRAGA